MNRYVDRIITKNEKDKFAESLKKHQKAIIYDDFSVLDRAVIEHNIVAISKLYETISFDTLSKMLDITKYFVRDIFLIWLLIMDSVKKLYTE